MHEEILQKQYTHYCEEHVVFEGELIVQKLDFTQMIGPIIQTPCVS